MSSAPGENKFVSVREQERVLVMCGGRFVEILSARKFDLQSDWTQLETIDFVRAELKPVSLEKALWRSAPELAERHFLKVTTGGMKSL